MKILTTKKGEIMIQLGNGKVYDFEGNHHHTLAVKKAAQVKEVKSSGEIPVAYRYFNSLDNLNYKNGVGNLEEYISHAQYGIDMSTADKKLAFIEECFEGMIKSKKNSLLSKIFKDNINIVEVISDGSGFSCDIDMFNSDTDPSCYMSVVANYDIKGILSKNASFEEKYQRWYDEMFKSVNGDYKKYKYDLIPGLDYKKLFKFFEKFYKENNYKNFYEWDIIEAVIYILLHSDKLILHDRTKPIYHDDDIYVGIINKRR